LKLDHRTEPNEDITSMHVGYVADDGEQSVYMDHNDQEVEEKAANHTEADHTDTKYIVKIDVSTKRQASKGYS